jgi:cellobiose phosphorylase
MDKPLWKFTDNQGTFASQNANELNSLYFPLCNTYPFMSSITPDLHGDIKTDFNSFLLEPVSRIDLSNSKTSRNFWVYVNPQKIWSVTGVSKDIRQIKQDRFRMEAGLLWQKVTRSNKRIGLKAEITSFVPASAEPAEIMRVDITNISKKSIRFVPAAAIPVFARSAHNLHDHRHVTSLLNRIEKTKFGVIVKPALSFDERGHKKNLTRYFVLGLDAESCAPEHIYPTREEFTGTGSDLEAPGAIFNNCLPDKNYPSQGKEAMAGLRFKTQTLRPRKTLTYIILMGIARDKAQINRVFRKFNTPDKVQSALDDTRRFWQAKSSQIVIHSNDADFDNWLRWVSIQPVLRKIFGCSFLPDFDYGRGGRGWRDLWQDSLSLILNNPAGARPLLINNFSGVRVDGSNATIVGSRPGEFIADRNNISRVWMDHGIWPVITTLLYIHQTGDLKILLKKIPYFRDRQLCRSREIDIRWRPEHGTMLKSRSGKIYRGTILEHMLVQNLVQFFNVGPHNHIRLENADWNDGLDMAAERGESVAFTSLYANDLNNLALILEKLGPEKITMLEELTILLDTAGPIRMGHRRNSYKRRVHPIRYSSAKQKQRLLKKYFEASKYSVSGKQISLPTAVLIRDLRKKAEWITEHIRRNEWLKEGFFNGYYGNDRKPAEGRIKGILRMTLAGQAFPVMSGIATLEQTKTLFVNAKKYLKDPTLGGFRLNTDFKEEQLTLGRAFSFIYGDKENGAFFSHMAVMFAYALYHRGLAREGREVIDAIFRMAQNTSESKIYPCLPEYFNAQGRGMYSYLTGSASWLVFTLLTQVFGVRGEYGNLLIEPKLTGAQFNTGNTISITTAFAGRAITVKFINHSKKDFGSYKIIKVRINGKTIAQDICQGCFLIPRRAFLALADRPQNILEITLD